MKKIITVPMVALGLALMAFAFIRVHANYNRGHDVYGRGSIIVEDCHKTGEAYTCIGDFRQYGGMVSVAGAEVMVDKKYPAGEKIDDIFPHYKYQNVDRVAATFETGAQRRSVGRNLPFVLIGIVGAYLVIKPLGSKWY